MKLIYGTNNKAKLDGMKKILSGLDIEITSLEEINMDLFESEENGLTPLDNAKEKALNYYQQIKKPIFSCDSGLYFKEVADHEQPSVKIRRPSGKRLNDEEMIVHYSKLASQYGGRLTAYYKNAICLVLDENTIICHDGEDIANEEFILLSKPHPKSIEGFPLDSLSVHIGTGEYYYDLDYSAHENEDGLKSGFRDFFIRSLGK